MNQDNQIERQITELLSQMSLEEKVGQLNQQPLVDDISSLEDGVRNGTVGSVVLAYTPFAGRESRRDLLSQREHLQRIACEESRLKIPLLLGRDVLHGHHTVFPIPLAQAAAWDPMLSQKASVLAADEAASEYVNWVFAPMTDVARDPRWGRIVEGYGEDPYLSGRYAESAVKGFQQRGSVSACAKHFLGYGASEGGRDYSHVDLSEEQLRNVYLPPFRRAVAAGVETVMASFNDINGVPVTANRKLLAGLLKNELGFDGVVVSDWNAIGQLVDQGAAADRRDAARMAFLAGVDIDMCSNCYSEHLADLVREGACLMQQLDDAVRRVLRIKLRRLKQVSALPSVSKAEARKTAYELAQKSIVLLKNSKSTLPLPARGPIALIGSVARQRRIHLGSWTLDGRADQAVSILEGLSARKKVISSCSDQLGPALRAAAQASTSVVVLGEHWDHTGEARGSSALSLPETQLAVLRAAASACSRVVAVICAGRPVCLTEVAQYADAILFCWHGGVEAGNAIASVLCGEICPSGKLPVSLPRHAGQLPLYYNQRPAARAVDNYYGEGTIPSYLDSSAAPLYPFGYGMSYTSFSYGTISSKKTQYRPGDVICVEVQICNNGKRAAEEVCQCYVQGLGGGRTHPLRELKGFQRIYLEPGEEKTVSFVLPVQELAYQDGPGGLAWCPHYVFWIGGSCYAKNQITLHII